MGNIIIARHGAFTSTAPTLSKNATGPATTPMLRARRTDKDRIRLPQSNPVAAGKVDENPKGISRNPAKFRSQGPPAVNIP